MYNDVTNINITSRYYDINSFISRFKNSKNPIILSLNIQSLHSKYNELKSFINELANHNVKVDQSSARREPSKTCQLSA
jgi:hypothetical protein